MMKMRIAVLGLGVLVAGCSSSPPVLLNASEQGVVVRYNQAGATSADAAAAAQKYCGQYGRKAVENTGNEETGDTFISYTCEKP